MKKGGARAKRRHMNQIVYGAVYQVVDVAMFDSINWGLFEAVIRAVAAAVDGVVCQALDLIEQAPVHEDPPHPKLELYLDSVKRG
jgi:hypothetical protein